jgi:MFS transporter, DHA1 family, multidrug resistance protein
VLPPLPPKLKTEFNIGRVELMFMLSLLMALNALAIDAMLPALTALGLGLGVRDTNTTQFVITAFLFGLGCGSVAHGPLSDRFGRRAVILGALIVYVCCAFGCALVSDFQTLVVLRFVQGVASAASSVVGIAIVRDRMSGDQMARMTSTMYMIFMIVPVIAPSIGQLVLWIGGWREIFLLLAIMGILMASWVWWRLPETLNPANVIALDGRTIIQAWGQVARNRHAVLYTMGGALVLGALYGFLSASSQLFAALLGSADLFPIAFAGVALAMASTNFLNSRIVERFGARRVSHTAVLIFILLGGLQFGLALCAQAPLSLVLSALAVNLSMVGLIGANMSAIAMTPFGHIAGTASSFQNSVRTITGTAIGAFIGQRFDGTAAPMSLGFLLCGLAALGCIFAAEHGKLFTRPRTTIPPAS